MEHKDEVENEMKTLTKEYADSPAMFIKSALLQDNRHKVNKTLKIRA